MNDDVAWGVAWDMDDVRSAWDIQDLVVVNRFGRFDSWHSQEPMANCVSQQRRGIGTPCPAKQPAPWEEHGPPSKSSIRFVQEDWGTGLLREAWGKASVIGMGVSDQDCLDIFDTATHSRQAFLEQSVVPGETAVDDC